MKTMKRSKSLPISDTSSDSGIHPDVYKPVKIYVYENKIDFKPPMEVAVTNHHGRNWLGFLDYIGDRLGTLRAVHFLYTTSGRCIRSFSSLKEGGHYVAVNDKFKKMNYGQKINEENFKIHPGPVVYKDPSNINSLESLEIYASRMGLQRNGFLPPIPSSKGLPSAARRRPGKKKKATLGGGGKSTAASYDSNSRNDESPLSLNDGGINLDLSQSSGQNSTSGESSSAADVQKQDPIYPSKQDTGEQIEDGESPQSRVGTSHSTTAKSRPVSQRSRSLDHAEQGDHIEGTGLPQPEAQTPLLLGRQSTAQSRKSTAQSRSSKPPSAAKSGDSSRSNNKASSAKSVRSSAVSSSYSVRSITSHTVEGDRMEDVVMDHADPENLESRPQTSKFDSFATVLGNSGNGSNVSDLKRSRPSTSASNVKPANEANQTVEDQSPRPGNTTEADPKNEKMITEDEAGKMQPPGFIEDEAEHQAGVVHEVEAFSELNKEDSAELVESDEVDNDEKEESNEGEAVAESDEESDGEEEEVSEDDAASESGSDYVPKNPNNVSDSEDDNGSGSEYVPKNPDNYSGSESLSGDEAEEDEDGSEAENTASDEQTSANQAEAENDPDAPQINPTLNESENQSSPKPVAADQKVNSDVR